MKAKHVLGIAAAVAMFAGMASTAEAADVTLRFANVTNQPSIDAAQVFIDVAKKNPMDVLRSSTSLTTC